MFITNGERHQVTFARVVDANAIASKDWRESRKPEVVSAEAAHLPHRFCPHTSCSKGKRVRRYIEDAKRRQLVCRCALKLEKRLPAPHVADAPDRAAGIVGDK